MIRLFLVIFVLTFVAFECNKESNPPATKFADEDSTMNFAMTQARLSISVFTHALSNPQPTQRHFSIKAMFFESGQVEHIWLDSPFLPFPNVFAGSVGNDPVYVHHIEYGDTVAVNLSRISDWMFVDHDTLCGGFTIRVMREHLSADKKEEFDKALDFHIK